MADGVVQVPPDSTGAKMRTRTRVVASNTVHEQYIAQAADPTYYIWSTPAACAQNRQVLSILNASGSTVLVKVRKLFLINAQLSAVTGVGAQWDVKRATAHSGGTLITPETVDSADGAINASVTCRSGATSVTEGNLLFSTYSNTDEVLSSAGSLNAGLYALISLMPEGPEIKELNLRAGEGLTVKQITNTTVGTYGALAVVTVES